MYGLTGGTVGAGVPDRPRGEKKNNVKKLGEFASFYEFAHVISLVSF